MSDPLQQALPDMLAYLMTLARDGIRPEEARARLRQLQPKYPELKLDLLWEEEAYDQSIHYDVLLQLPSKGTVSLSFGPDRALPWPLRGLHHWSEKQLVRVNRTGLTVSQAI